MTIHQPIMKTEAIGYLVTDSQGFYVDATFGGGGHSQAILEATGAKSLVLALDRDERAVAKGVEKFRGEPRMLLKQQRFSLMAEEVNKVDRPLCGVLMDVGLSSDQLDDPTRGFSMLHEGPLDMRMDSSHGMTAHQFLVKASETALADCLSQFGEEPYAKQIAALIVKRRRKHELATTRDLLEIIEAAVPQTRLRRRQAATRTFQAIRIVINDEIDELEQGLHQAANLLALGGRLVVISFHSLEHRLVKTLIRSRDSFGQGMTEGGIKPLVTAQKPHRNELHNNRRARSAILRVMEKVKH